MKKLKNVFYVLIPASIFFCIDFNLFSLGEIIACLLILLLDGLDKIRDNQSAAQAAKKSEAANKVEPQAQHTSRIAGRGGETSKLGLTTKPNVLDKPPRKSLKKDDFNKWCENTGVIDPRTRKRKGDRFLKVENIDIERKKVEVRFKGKDGTILKVPAIRIVKRRKVKQNGME